MTNMDWIMLLFAVIVGVVISITNQMRWPGDLPNKKGENNDK